MNARLTVSAELVSSVQRMKSRTWRDAHAQAFEQGAAPTLPAAPERLLGMKPAGSVVSRGLSRLFPRPCRKRLTDEQRTKRRHRKRMLGGSSAMPDGLRHHYTEGERAVLCIIAGEVKRHGVCDLSVVEIGDRAGVGRTTVQNAMHHARLLGHILITERPQRGAKHLTNVVRIVSAEWLAWIKRAPSAARGIGSNSSASVSTSKNIDQNNRRIAQAERPQGAIRRERWDAAQHHSGHRRGGA